MKNTPTQQQNQMDSHFIKRLNEIKNFHHIAEKYLQNGKFEVVSQELSKMRYLLELNLLAIDRLAMALNLMDEQDDEPTLFDTKELEPKKLWSEKAKITKKGAKQ